MGAPRGERKKKHIKFNKELGRLIKDSRKVWGYIQYDLLEDFGSSQKLSGIETGNTDCTLYDLYMLIHFLGIPKEDIIEFLYDNRYIEEVTTLEIKTR